MTSSPERLQAADGGGGAAAVPGRQGDRESSTAGLSRHGSPARDGVELQGLLFLPDDASRRGDGPPPVLFLVHGGPTAQSMATFNPVAQYHVDRGVAVFQPNVRGSTGCGRSYVTLDDREKRLDSVRDLVACSRISSPQSGWVLPPSGFDMTVLRAEAASFG